MREAHVDISPYSGPQLPTLARKLVAELTDLPERYVEVVDDNVATCFPPGTVVHSIKPHGHAYWTRTAQIETQQADGSKLSYFIKVTHTEIGASNLRGEFASMKIIHEAVPDFSPVPIAVGDYASDPNVHFYLSSFVDMTDEPAELDTLPNKLAELHTKAVSPNGKYGFDVPTNMGALVMPNEWNSSWEAYYTLLMKRLYAWEKDMHGPDAEMEQYFNNLVEKVIPRLLRPLETGGREIQPRLVHGDLWDGNASTNIGNDQACIFDASSFYAHNEYELGAWNLPRHQIYRTYIRAYQRCFSISEPKEDVDDRLILYRVRFNLVSSACYLNNMHFRQLAKDDMASLVFKYSKGYEGTESMKAET